MLKSSLQKQSRSLNYLRTKPSTHPSNKGCDKEVACELYVYTANGPQQIQRSKIGSPGG